MKTALWWLAMCGIGLVTPAAWGGSADAGFPQFDDPHLKRGREIWLGTCKVCHGPGFADAPSVRDKAAWAPRLAKGKPVLYEHALNGFFGPMGTMMPPRGGNNALTDDEVKAAVDYMTTIVKE